MLTDYTLTDADIGRVLPIADGFVVKLWRTQAGPYEMPQWSEGKQQWKAGYLVLRGSREFRDLICINSSSSGGWASQWGRTATVLSNASLGYLGELMIVGVPKGSVWELTLSDQPYVKQPTAWPPVLPPAGPKVIDQHRGAKETARRARAVMDATRAPV